MPLFMDNAELTAIAQQLMPERTTDDIVFNDVLRVRSIAESIILFEQRDSFDLYTPARSQETGWGQLARENKSRITVTPYDYGEEKVMDESFLRLSRQMGEFGQPQRNADEQMSDTIHLIDRFIKRYKYNVWTLLTTGTYSALGPKGEYVGGDSYTFQSFTVNTAWSNFGSSVPIEDLRTMRLQHRGTSASFGRKCKIYLQSQDVINLLSNTNANDLGAKRVITQNAGAQPFQLGDVNNFLLDSDLPQIVEYDEFIPTSVTNFGTGVSTYNMLIPYQTGVALGARDYGEPIGDYTMIPQFPDLVGSAGGAQGWGGSVRTLAARGDSAFANVYLDFKVDMDNWNAKTRIAFGGAPRILYPTAIIIMNLN
jgi:hypothetical protein